MSTALIAAWVVLILLWVVSFPGLAIAFAAIGDPPRGFIPGWLVAFLGWLSIPVAGVAAIVAVVHHGTDGLLVWLPVASILAMPAGYLLGVAGAAVARLLPPNGSQRNARAQPDPRPAPKDLTALDDSALIASQLELMSHVVEEWFPLDYVGGIDPAFPRLVLDTVRHRLDGEPVRRALGDLSDYELGRKILHPQGRQAAFMALARFARLCAIGGPHQLPRRDDAAHQQLIRLAEYALTDVDRRPGD